MIEGKTAGNTTLAKAGFRALATSAHLLTLVTWDSNARYHPRLLPSYTVISNLMNHSDKVRASIISKETEELIEIAHSDTDHWQQIAIDMAKEELRMRGVTLEQQQAVLDEWQTEYDQLVEEHSKQLKENETKGYTHQEKVQLFLLAPLWIVLRWPLLGKSTVELREGNFKRKISERGTLIISGFIFWFLIGIFYLNKASEESDQRRRAEIDAVDISDWEREYYGEDTANLTSDTLP